MNFLLSIMEQELNKLKITLDLRVYLLVYKDTFFRSTNGIR